MHHSNNRIKSGRGGIRVRETRKEPEKNGRAKSSMDYAQATIVKVIYVQCPSGFF